MKKFIALTIGLSFLGAAFLVTSSEASREAYHSYLSQKVKEDGSYRNSTSYQGNQKQALSPRTVAVKKSFTQYKRRSYVIPKTGRRNMYSSKSADKTLRLRTSTNRIMRKQFVKNSHRATILSETLESSNFLFTNYSNETFSLEIPSESIISDENGMLEINIPRVSTKISAKKLDNTCGKNLTLCARAISRTADRNDDIYRTSETVQQHQKTDIVLGSNGLNSEKFVEGFIGITEGKSSFIARFIVEGIDGDLFLVEASSDLEDIDKTVVFAKKAFETFRAKY